MFSMDDHRHMARALRLAQRGRYTVVPNPVVGCLLVRDGAVVGEGWHLRAGEGHAEVNALNMAGERARGCTAYVTLEPCCHQGRTPPCSAALIAAGVARVVVAMQDPNPQVAGQGLQQLQRAGIAVSCGLLQQQAEALNPGFISRMRRQRPFVRCKLAMSLDGRTAMADGSSRWITGAAARRDVHLLRARSDAVVTGIDTVLADDPQMTVRDVAVDVFAAPLRVVLDSRLRIAADAHILNGAAPTLIVTSAQALEKQRDRCCELEQSGVAVELVRLAADGSERIDLNHLLTLLAERGINDLLIESGPTLSGAMMQQGLIDELVVYMAAHLMGSDARSLFQLPGMDAMEQRIQLEFKEVRMVGDDVRMTLRPVGASG
ncbi:MAG: bifunctional diaminohydroxyphosphoribosylaminopyrimidine deaminase/5-amino-6-(5-phosphoribosylamino)uracil reductase RibD [Gammaproteobacteria bacterium]|nr:bifunctional diaminohydroxyphosphoribosylaminopyrimidine deaminase/5-amino-6-(5-phosphoribosylamino)uracil reductase RibD [Gammaproteobacteria bacterium]